MPVVTKLGSGDPSRVARKRRHTRVRKKVRGTAERPRMVVNRSARHLFVQVVDDREGRTLASASTMESDIRARRGDKTAAAKMVGERLAQRAKDAGSRRRVRPRRQQVPRPRRGPGRCRSRGRPEFLGVWENRRNGTAATGRQRPQPGQPQGPRWREGRPQPVPGARGRNQPRLQGGQGWPPVQLHRSGGRRRRRRPGGCRLRQGQRGPRRNRQGRRRGQEELLHGSPHPGHHPAPHRGRGLRRRRSAASGIARYRCDRRWTRACGARVRRCAGRAQQVAWGRTTPSTSCTLP